MKSLSTQKFFVVALALLSIETHAASQGSQPIEEIIVTAQQQRRTIQETQHSVEVFTAETIRTSTFRNLEELLATMPNVEAQPDGRGVVIRGVPDRGYGGDLSTQLTLIDGFYSPGIRHFWDVSQIEVLRGAQTTAGSAIGGTFGITYQPATFERSGRAMANWAPDTDSGELGLALGGPIVDDVLAIRVAAYARESDGYVTNVFTGEDDWADLSERFYRGVLRWQPDDTTDISLAVLYQDIEKGGRDLINQMGPDGQGAFKFNTAIDTPEYDHQRNRDIYLRMRKTFDNGVEIYSFLSDHRWRQGFLFDLDYQPTDGGTTSQNFRNRANGAGTYIFYDAGHWSFSGQLYSFLFDINGTSELRLPLDFDGPGPVPGVFGNGSLGFPTDDWWIAGSRFSAVWSGARWSFNGHVAVDGSWATETRSVISTRATSTGIPALDAAYDGLIVALFPSLEEVEDTDNVNVSPMLSVSYNLAHDITVGVKWERAFRRGWTRINPVQGLIVPYDPEQADEFDISLRSSYFGGQLVVNGNIFYTDIKDQQLDYCFSPAPLDCHIVNAGASHNTGLEINVSGYRGDFSVRVSAGLLKAEIDELDLPNLDPAWLDRQLPNTPEWKFNATLTYDPGQGLFGSIDLTLRPETDGGLGVTESFNEARQLVNARLGWRFSKWSTELSLWARNLTDDHYFEFFNPVGPNAYGGAPREIGLTLASTW